MHDVCLERLSLPFTSSGGWASTLNRPRTCRYVSALMRILPTGAAFSSRAATLTVSPRAVYSPCVPSAPSSTLPVLMPTLMRNFGAQRRVRLQVVQHFQRGADGAFRVVFPRLFAPPDSHHPIAQMFVNRAAVRQDDGIQALPHPVHQVADVFRVERFGHRRKAGDIREQNGDEFALLFLLLRPEAAAISRASGPARYPPRYRPELRAALPVPLCSAGAVRFRFAISPDDSVKTFVIIALYSCCASLSFCDRCGLMPLHAREGNSWTRTNPPAFLLHPRSRRRRPAYRPVHLRPHPPAAGNPTATCTLVTAKPSSLITSPPKNSAANSTCASMTPTRPKKKPSSSKPSKKMPPGWASSGTK